MTAKTSLTILLTAVAAAAAPALASADSLVVPATGAQNLASGGGYLAWSAPAPGGGYQLVLRAPDGTVSTPALPTSRRALDPAIGSDRFGIGGRRLLVVYSRDGDVHAYDVKAGSEEKVPAASTKTYEETAPSIEYGRLTFVRRGGPRNGVMYFDGKHTKLVTRATPRETSMNGSRVAYPSGNNVVIRKLSGKGATAAIPTPSPGFSLVLTRYRLQWLASGGRVLQTDRFGGSSGIPKAKTAEEASRRLPASTNSIAMGRTFIDWSLDGQGVHRVDPKLFR